MNLVLTTQLAARYLRGKRGANAVPILSRISMVAIAVGSCAMIVLLSVFNGFESLVKDLYKSFYPGIKITASKGKFFSLGPDELKNIKNVKGIGLISYAIEDNALAISEDQQLPVVLKGIDSSYVRVNNILPFIVEGGDSVSGRQGLHTAIIGSQLANQVGVDVSNVFSYVTLFYPKELSPGSVLNPESAFSSLQLRPEGKFRIQDEFDSKYLLAPLGLVQELFNAQGKVSSLELSLNEKANDEDIKEELQKALGTAYMVETRYEQNRTQYMVMQTEKWAMYGILLLVFLIASFNMIGALTLLVMEKRKDIAILKAMGALDSTIRQIFTMGGVLWALIGGVFGLLLGALICLGQAQFHWIKLQGSFIIDAFPVKMQWTDFVLVLCTIVLVGLLAAWYPAIRSTRTEDPSLKST